MSTLQQTQRWLGTDVMMFIAGVGLVVGAACGLIFGFGPNPVPIFSALMFGIGGMMLGLGLGAFLYAPRWAIMGSLLATALIATLLLVGFLMWGIDNAPQQGAQDAWTTFAIVLGIGAVWGAALGGLLKGLLDESRLERWRIAESQRVEKDRYWSYIKRAARHRLRLFHPLTTPLHIAVLVFLQVRFEFFAPVIVWGFLTILILQWIARRWLAISGYRSWRKAYGVAPFSEDLIAQSQHPIPEMAQGREPFLPYSVFASKRDFQKLVLHLSILFGIGGLVIIGTMPDGWVLLLCSMVFSIEPLSKAYHFWQREKRIAEGESADSVLAHEAS